MIIENVEENCSELIDARIIGDTSVDSDILTVSWSKIISDDGKVSCESITIKNNHGGEVSFSLGHLRAVSGVLHRAFKDMNEFRDRKVKLSNEI